ncbi:MAG TPA: hypothetical protein VF904_20045 [Anaeromyxobacteraceae bacterium]
MGAQRRTCQAVVAAVVLCAGARASASVQVEPIARLSLEGGYDSNFLYDGRGGDVMGRVSPDLGLTLRDHTWMLALVGGGDLLLYEQRARAPVWNQRGTLQLAMRPDHRSTLTAEVGVIYAADPIGLARLGIFGRSDAGLIVQGAARAAWRLDHDWRIAGTFAERVVRFDDGTGAASHTPGVEATRQLDHHLEVGGAYRFDVFQAFGAGAQDAYANELQAVARYRWTRRLTMEAEGGPALWIPPGAGAPSVLPQAMVQLLEVGRVLDARVTLRHGVGLGILATPGLTDTVEAAAALKVGRSWKLHSEGGIWRSGAIPWGADGVVGYGIAGEVLWLLGGGVQVGFGASRFARADSGTTLYDRNIVGLRVGWELRGAHH